MDRNARPTGRGAQLLGFWQLAEDQANRRINGGIHFRFENEVSQESCPKVTEYIFRNFMRPHER